MLRDRSAGRGPQRDLLTPTTTSHPFALCLRSRGFGQSNSLPTAGSAGAGLGRRNPRQFQIPSRNLPTARLGLLGPSGLLGTPQRSPAASPAILKQGRQVGHSLIRFLCFSSSNLSGSPVFKPKGAELPAGTPLPAEGQGKGRWGADGGEHTATWRGKMSPGGYCRICMGVCETPRAVLIKIEGRRAKGLRPVGLAASLSPHTVSYILHLFTSHTFLHLTPFYVSRSFTSHAVPLFAPRRTSGLPTLGAATACPAGATARCKGRARCRCTPPRRPC